MTNAKSRMTNCKTLRPIAGSIAMFLTSIVVSHSSHAELAELAQSRKAIAENIPQVAIFKLNAALASPALAPNERTAAQRLLAEAQIASSQYEQALKTLAQITDLTDSTAALLRAHSLVGAGRWGEALPIYKSLSKLPTSLPSAALGEAECLQALGQTAEAADALERFVKSADATTASQLRLASLRVELGHLKEAHSLLSSAAKGSPTDEKWRAYIGARILLLEKKPQAALAALEQMLKPDDAQRIEGLSDNLYAAVALAEAEARLSMSGPDAAEKSLEAFINKNPESPHLELIFRRLDQIYAVDKTPTEGALHKIVRDLPPKAGALAQFYVARLQLREKRYVKADSSLKLFLKQFPEHALTPEIHAMQAELALTTAGAGDTKKALANAESALIAASRTARDDEQRAEFALRTALVNLQQGEFISAATHLETAKYSPRLRQNAAYNTALAWLMQKNFTRFREDIAVFADEQLAGQLFIEAGLVQSRANEIEAPKTLRAFLNKHPEHPRRAEAQIALAELDFQLGNTLDTKALIQTIADSAPTPEMIEQSEYLAVFLEEAKKPRDDEKVITLARAFASAHPQSPHLADVRMKLGQVYFQREDFLNAQEQFETVSRAESAFTETALFLAGQCAMKLISSEALNHSLELFGKVTDRKGSLEAHARLQQAIIKNKLGAEDDAVKIYDSLLGTPKPPDPEVRYAALVGKGDNLVLLGKKDPKQTEAALTSYDHVLALPEAGPSWRNQAAYKKGKALQQLDRNDEALALFYDILDRSTTGPRETFWYAKAGFDAAGILEARQQWKNAIGIYEKMAKLSGPHAEQAKQRVKTLRLEHFLWD
jgi:predicted negative regulator of RcsB-dependent stress response